MDRPARAAILERRAAGAHIVGFPVMLSPEIGLPGLLCAGIRLFALFAALLFLTALLRVLPVPQLMDQAFRWTAGACCARRAGPPAAISSWRRVSLAARGRSSAWRSWASAPCAG
jgi:hypothetical protein